jgi:hypothetical protein
MPSLSESDRRFALLVDILSFGRRRGNRWLRVPPFSRTEFAMERNEQPIVVDPNERPVVTDANKEKVRAGVTGHGVRYVVIFGVALVVVLFIAVAAFVRP